MEPISTNLFSFTQITTVQPEGATVMDAVQFLRYYMSGTLPNEPISVSGSLELSDSYDLTKLPRNLKVELDLDLQKCRSLTTLPAGLYTGGDLDLGHCKFLRELPQGLRVCGGLYLNGCTSLRELPEALQVGGNLDLSYCNSLEALPERLDVGKDLYLIGLRTLERLPVEFHVGKSFRFCGCTSLRELPPGLKVDGYLDLSGCTALRELPPGLKVEGYLDLSGCTSLMALPQRLQANGNLILSGCTALTSLPNDITSWGPRGDGKTREVDLTGTGISDELINRLKSTEAPGMRFLFSRQATPVANEFATLVHGVNFWSALLPRGEVSSIQMDLRRDQEIDLTRFLNRFKATAEYQNLAARPTLAKRIYDVLREMQVNEDFKETACLIIHQGLSTCDDRIISALDEIDLMMQIKKAEKKGEREELRKLGKAMLMLEEVQKAAGAHARTLTWVDEIEILLAFQIALRDRLQLPLSTGHMIFRGCAHVSDEKIQEVGAEIERRVTDAKVEEYLQNWSPWQKLLRREAFDALEPEVVQAPEDLEWVCCVGTEELREGYLYEGRLYAPETLRKIYIEKANDPFTRDLIHLQNVKKVVCDKYFNNSP